MPPAQQQASQGGQQGGSQNSSDLFWIIAMVVVGFVMLWYFEKGPITKAIFWVRLKEIHLITSSFILWRDTIHLLQAQSWAPTWVIVHLIKTVPTDMLDLNDWVLNTEAHPLPIWKG